MRSKYTILILLGIILACSPVQLSQDLSNSGAMKIYRNASDENEKYTLTYNTDSSFVICTLNDNSQMVSEPVSFLVVNLNKKEKVFVSMKEYHRARWIDLNTIVLVKFLGVPNIDRNLTRKPISNRMEYVLDVHTKELKQRQESDQETL